METTQVPNKSENFRLWLQKEFTDRSRGGMGLSLRGFARMLEMEASSVSQILTGKRGVSFRTASQICDRLSVPPDLRNHLLAGLSRAPSPAAKAPANYHQLTADAFAMMADWYHYAILELTYTADFQSSPQWIARKLGIGSTEATVAVERLMRLEMLEVRDGKLVKTEEFVTNFADGQTAPALKELQRQLLRKALEAVDQVPAERKDITSMTMSANPAKLPEAKQKIRAFRRELCAFLNEGPQTAVFNLGVQLFPLSEMNVQGEMTGEN